MVSRRSVVRGLLTAASGATGIAMTVPLLRVALHPILQQTTQSPWSDAGPVDAFTAGSAPSKVLLTIEQRDGWRTIQTTRPVYVVRSPQGQVRVLSAVCPHLGCTIGWNDERRQFVSPCHNGVFQPDGSLVSGPPPRGMDELESTVEGGRLKVRYQYFRQLVPSREVIA